MRTDVKLPLAVANGGALELTTAFVSANILWALNTPLGSLFWDKDTREFGCLLYSITSSTPQTQAHMEADAELRRVLDWAVGQRRISHYTDVTISGTVDLAATVWDAETGAKIALAFTYNPTTKEVRNK